MKIVHIADVHWRSLTRHDEYKEIFSDLFGKMRELEPDVIYIGGDIFHTKTQGITPEVIDCLSWWFTELAKICDVHVILGNHDGNLTNLSRQDAISPIIAALDNPKIHLYKKSGMYPTGHDGFTWSVFSCFDEDNWDNVKPVPGDVNIALFHGSIHGALTDSEWELKSGDLEISRFQGYDFALLGDIHKRQFLTADKRIAYCGSTIQQNYGESADKGFLFWDIKSSDDFDVKFIESKVVKPYVTVDWNGSVEDVVTEAKKSPMGSRFRVRSEHQLHQVDIKQLFNEIKHQMKATEVVLKDDFQADKSQITTTSSSFFKKDLRDINVHMSLLQDFLSEEKIDKKSWDMIREMVTKYLTSINNKEDELTRNVAWSIRKLTFDNTFGYGKGNVIDFDKLSGITGVFGPNRSGKSSFVGTLMYALFNATDRGAIKNLHVINSRKGHCSAAVDLTINGLDHLIERQTIRKESKKGQQHGVTSVNFTRTDGNGHMVKDLNGLQRSDTEKVIRKKIGLHEDFMLTSLATQESMKGLIGEGATQRRSIIAKFMNLDVFEKMYDLAKADSEFTKAHVKSAPDRDWDALIRELNEQQTSAKSERKKIEKELSKKRLNLQELQVELATFDKGDIVTRADVDMQKKLVLDAEHELEGLHEKLENATNEFDTISSKLKKIEAVRESINIDDLRTRALEHDKLEKELVNLESAARTENQTLAQQERSVQKLKEVPCGDKFPMCKFIKDSHLDKQRISVQREHVKSIELSIESLTRSLEMLRNEDVKGRIKKYDDLMLRKNELELDLSRKQNDVNVCKHELEMLEQKIDESAKTLREMETKCDDHVDDEFDALKRQINELSSSVNTLDAKRMSVTELLGNVNTRLERLKDDRDEYLALRDKWQIYQHFMNAMSKSGIPSRIIHSQLPLVNSEISKILNGIVDFTVSLDASIDTNALDIHLDYGDSRRIIELGSNMEKFISAIAIRVALYNLSSLPRSDLFVIDEGFGALDETNVEAISRLLKLLKQSFKNIIIITHVDSMKDVVDNMLEITRENGNARLIYE